MTIVNNSPSNIVGKRQPIRARHGLQNNYPRVIDRLHDIVNGGINHGGITPATIGVSAAFSPGATSIQGNTDSVHCKAVFSVTDTDVTITHNLGRLPTGYRVASSNNPVQVYNGSVTFTSTQMTLRGHLVGAAATCILEVY